MTYHGLADKYYHGLPEGHPFDDPEFVKDQAAHAKKTTYKGISDGSEWHLKDGTRLEIWPGGAVFSEYGTYMGHL